MNHIKRAWMCLVLVISLLLPSLVSVGQNTAATSGDWSVVKSVTSGTKLSIKLKSGKTVSGNLREVSDSSLTLSLKNTVQEFNRDDVYSVHQVTNKSATKATLIGMGVGAGAGAGIGASAGSNSDGFEKIDHAVTAGLAVVGAGVGAAMGYLLGRGGSKRVLLYQSR